MGKYAKYSKHFQDRWLSEPIFAAWLKKTENGQAFCRFCNSELRPHKADLRKHMSTKLHKSRAIGPAHQTNQKPLSSFGIGHIKDNDKKVDLKIAMFIAMHGSIQSVDHLGELMKSITQEESKTGYSYLSRLRLHKTKCHKLIVEVIAPCFLHSLIADVDDQAFSLIVDESTDISVTKYLCVCIRYFSKLKIKIVTELLGLIKIEKATAIDLYNSLTHYCLKIGLNLKNLSGLATDGGSNLCGSQHSLFTLLRDAYAPKLILSKCICHSLHLCASKAATELPSSLEFLVRETYNWFKISPLRQHHYNITYKLINTPRSNPKKFQKLSGTRWLARYESFQNIFSQYLELKTHFSLVGKNENCFLAKTLSNMFNDATNYVYLTFLNPILKEVNTLNLAFQQEKGNIFKMYHDLDMFIMSLARRIMKPAYLSDTKSVILNVSKDNAFLNLESMNFGFNFQTEIKKLRNGGDTTVKTRIFLFLKKLLSELCSRTPENFEIVKKFRFLCPEELLNAAKPPKFSLLPTDLMKPSMIPLYEEQFNILLEELQNFKLNETLEDPESFWCYIFSLKNSLGTQKYKDLASFALKCFLPVSNACVERVFSIMNTVKTKSRNRINVNTLESIVRIRVRNYSEKECCKTFTPTNNMLIRFTSKMYNENNNCDSTNTNNNNDDDGNEQVVDDITNLISILNESPFGEISFCS